MMFLGQRKKQKYAALEAQPRSNPSSAYFSTSPESSEGSSSSEAATLPPSSGVSLAQYQTNVLYPDTVVTTGDNTFDLQVLLDSPGVDPATGTYPYSAHLA
jgi:hypothetical protein